MAETALLRRFSCHGSRWSLMARDTRSRFEGETRNLERVSLDPSHWRSGRIFLLLQGVLIWDPRCNRSGLGGR